VAPAAARQALERLVDERLVTPVTGDRYRLHDLLRDYARGLALGDGGEAASAVDRVLTWYLYTADAAVHQVFPQNVEVVLDERARPEHVPVFGTDERAFQWLTAEHSTLVAAVTGAAADGRHELAWRLTAILRQYFERRSTWQDWLTTSQVALDAARRVGDRAAEALILNGLGLGYSEREQTTEAIECLTRSLEIRREIGDRRGESRSLNNLGITYGRRGEFDEAIRYLTAALAIRRTNCSLYDQSMTLSNLGRAYAGAGRHREAIDCLREALEVRRGLGHPVGVAWALYNLGAGLLGAERHEQAIAPLTEASDIFRANHCPRFEAGALEILGDGLMGAGEPARARQCWQRSLELYDGLDHPQAEAVRARLARHAEVPVANP
jgi:tetratricopeptide (TPR) repeat protein